MIKLLLVLLFITNNLFAEDSFSTLPVLHDGRVKPLDSYARIILKSIANKESINHQSASTWFKNLLLDPQADYNNPIFYIHNPDVQKILLLDISSRNKPYFSFKEILPGIKLNINLISQLKNNTSENNRLTNTPAENQLLDLYNTTLDYFDLSRSLSLLIPQFGVKQLEYIIPKNQLLNINQNSISISYYNILPYKNLIADNTTKIFNNYTKNYSNNNISNINTERNQAILTIANLFKNTDSDKINTSLKIIPHDHFNIYQDTNWLAPWEVINSGNGTPNTARYLNLLQNLVYIYYNTNQMSEKDQTNKFIKASDELKTFALDLAASNMRSANSTITPEKLNNLLITEYYYNKLKLLNKSLILYFFSLILAIYIFIKPSNNIKYKIKYLMFSTFILAVCCHLISLLMRIYILQRPPVANLYESILFVGLVTAILSIIIELLRKDNIGLLLGSLICVVLQFIANSYAANGDSLNILIAVLNNNFWLGTHVIAITSGYGCCLILSALSHIYLIYSCFNNKNNKIFKQQLFNYILAFGLLSLFLTLLGTILGGIWADQSWGRFWGWDPKENGALLICLWLIALLHGKISGQLNNILFVACAAMTSITVALAWFGVNLLSTGLHSYGFTENIATNLILFIIFELVLILGLIYFNTKLIKNNI